MSALTFFWKISESKAFCAPAAPEAVVGDFERKLAAEHATRLVDLFDRELGGLHDRGATTLLAPERPTGTPILIGPRPMLAKPVKRTEQVRKHLLRRLRDMIGLPFFHSPCSEEAAQYQPRLSCDPSISS